MRATASSLLIAISLCLSAASPTSAQQQTTRTWEDADGKPHSCKEWTWKDSHGYRRSCADLDNILKQHELWYESKGKSGARADLSFADLRGAALLGAHLDGADLSGAQLDGADLTGANLRDAHLSGAHLDGADLSGADLRYADLLSGADLSGADLTGAHLSGAVLIGVDLNGANASDADLDGALFEPKNPPLLESMAQAQGLELMTYEANPGRLTELRKKFQDMGYREQERAITCALNRHNADPSRLRASLEEKWKKIRRRSFDKDKIMPFKSFVEGTFKWIAFDLTCEYGLSYGRPLLIVGFLGLVSWLIYLVFMHRSGKSGVYFVAQWWRGNSRTRIVQIRPRAIRPQKRWRTPFLWLLWEWRVLRAAMFFSLMSAFNIGFRDINFGRWLRLLTKREYDLKAVGWARTVSGFQSLLSVYLIALWVLTYFGRPFG